MSRKTFEVVTLLDRVNHFLLNSADDQKVGREQLAIMLEGVLHDTGNYKGYSYLYETDMVHSKDGKSIGVIHNANGPGQHVFPDDSRRQYN